jgi:predicted nucleic acid-binding protein
MIVLDTNVIAETMRLVPEERVMGWLHSRPLSAFSMTSVTLAETLFGIETAPVGQKRRSLEKRFAEFLALGFGDQVLPFDEAAARQFAIIAATRKRMGRPISEFDAQIAAIAAAHGASLATRNVADFEHCGIDVINPWGE